MIFNWEFIDSYAEAALFGGIWASIIVTGLWVSFFMYLQWQREKMIQEWNELSGKRIGFLINYNKKMKDCDSK